MFASAFFLALDFLAASRFFDLRIAAIESSELSSAELTSDQGRRFAPPLPPPLLWM